MQSSLFLIVFGLASPLYASPTSNARLARRCGPVGQFYTQHTPADWTVNNVDGWLDDWTKTHQSDISSNAWGFAGAFGQWAIGDPNWSCRDDGSSSNCDLDLCDNDVLNERGRDLRPAYYVLESVNRFHSYFIGLSQAFETSAIAAALSKDSWALTFYRDKDVKSVTVLKEVLNAVAIVVGLGAAAAGMAGAGAGAAANAVYALYGGGINAAGVVLGAHTTDVFEKSADLGAILAKVVVGSMKSFTEANNQLMHGENYQNTGDIRTYLNGGLFVNFPGVDKNKISESMNNLIAGNAINALWRVQKIFIMGGGKCGDGEGIGQGPQQNSVCRDGKAWYLYYWQENDVISTTSHQWGWVNPPPGSDALGQGEYVGISVADVIISSLDSYNVAGYTYDASTASSRAQSALKDGWANPGAQGPSWEGTFTIPVCDVGSAVGADYFHKEFILQDYGHESRPVWCGPICDGDLQKTKDFIHAANMDNFKSPKHLCKEQPGY
ncbi:MAG: hypothetical protein M1833_004284 [Piccolia ochrophora]|nr:MAG: hypothetical protein M1833_004284 [Piccolia ochrophora]